MTPRELSLRALLDSTRIDLIEDSDGNRMRLAWNCTV